MNFWGSGFWSSSFWRSKFWAGPRESVTEPGGGGGGRFAEIRPKKALAVEPDEVARRRRRDEDALILALLELA